MKAEVNRLESERYYHAEGRHFVALVSKDTLIKSVLSNYYSLIGASAAIVFMSVDINYLHEIVLLVFQPFRCAICAFCALCCLESSSKHAFLNSVADNSQKNTHVLFIPFDH